MNKVKLITRANVGTKVQEITIPDNAKFIVINATVRTAQTYFTRMFPLSVLSQASIQDVFPLFYNTTTYCINIFTLQLLNGKYLLRYAQWSATSNYTSDGYVDIYWM